MPAPQAENGTPRTELQDLQHKSQQVTDDVSVLASWVKPMKRMRLRCLCVWVPRASAPAVFFKCNDKRCQSVSVACARSRAIYRQPVARRPNPRPPRLQFIFSSLI